MRLINRLGYGGQSFRARRLQSKRNVRKLAIEGLEHRELLTTFNVTSSDLTWPMATTKEVLWLCK